MTEAQRQACIEDRAAMLIKLGRSEQVAWATARREFGK